MNINEIVLHWNKNPVSFVEQVFNAKPEPWQCEALNAVVTNERIAIRSGKGVGKSTLLAWLILWFLATRHDVKIPCTATSAHQLYDVLWLECKKWIDAIDPSLSSLLSYRWTNDRIEIAGNFAVARTSRKEQPEALQGFHSENLLLLVDEASGVPEEVFKAAEGAMSTHGSRTVLTGNPTRTDGYFYDVFHKDRERWFTMRVRCHDSTRVTQDYIDAMLKKYGENASEYRVGVLGEFPTGNIDSVIPRSLIEQAVGVTFVDKSQPIWGVDVARSSNGDRTVLACRRMRSLEWMDEWRSEDLMHSAGKVADKYYSLPVDERPFKIVVDVIGYGAGVYDRLRELQLPVVACNVGGKKGCRPGYVRVRDDLWFRGREWFETGQVSIPYDDDLMTELSAVGYKLTSEMKRYIDDKKAAGWSPDRADAFLLTFYTHGWDIEKKVVRKDRPVYAESSADYMEDYR